MLQGAMFYSAFSNVQDVSPDPVECSWEGMVKWLGTHRHDLKSKLDAPAYSPAQWPEGGSRNKKDVQRVHFGVLDLDKLPMSELDRLLDLLDGWQYAFYTTWSHPALAARDLWAARLIVPFDRPVSPQEWPEFWPRFNALFGGLGDPACKDPSRIYFVPSAPRGTEDASYVQVGVGRVVLVHELLSHAVRHEEPDEPLSVDQVQDFQRRLSRQTKSAALKAAGKRLGLVLKGQPFAEPGERDDQIFKLTCLVVEEFPRARAKAIAALFATSLEVMRDVDPDGPSLQDVEDKVRRHQSDVLDTTFQQEQERAVSRAARLAEVGREAPYSEEEITAFAEEAGVSRAAFDRRWLIECGTSVYVFRNGTYAPPLPKDNLVTSVQRDLSPAPVSLFKLGRDGKPAPKSHWELLAEHGTVARSAAISFTAQKARYDAATETIIEAPCPLRDIRARFSPDVEKWLQLLAGESFPKLCDWISVITKLDEPCAALYLEGPPGCGKTLLADGLARLWTTRGPTAYEQAIAGFNSDLMGCPLVLADEVLPRDFRGSMRTGDLRQFIQARSHSLRRKYLTAARVDGAVRLIMTANNKELLATNENLSSNDIAAIVDRILYIECGNEAAPFLRTIDVVPFVHSNEIAAHALFLASSRVVARNHRFLVAGEVGTLHRSLTTQSGLRSAVCHWLVSYLLQPTKAEATKTKLVRVLGSELYATTRGLIEHWSMYKTNEEPPPAGPLSKALAGISFQKKRYMTAGDGKLTWYWKVDPENLLAWADANGYADIEQLAEALDRAE